MQKGLKKKLKNDPWFSPMLLPATFTITLIQFSMQELLSQEIILQNHKARLETLRLDHFAALKAIALNNSLWEFTSTKIYSEKDLLNYLNKALKERERGLSYPFVVIDVTSGQVAGSTRYGNISPENRRVEIGWTWYSPLFQRTGLNRGCKFELLQFAFEKLGCIRVELKTSLLNIRSQTAMEKIGAKKEGVFRSHMMNDDGTIRDTVFFSIIREEWPEIKQTIFKEFLS